MQYYRHDLENAGTGQPPFKRRGQRRRFAKGGLSLRRTISMIEQRSRREARMKLAVFLPNWVGDVAMATPALRALREHFSDATILGIMRPYVAEVLAGTHFLNETYLDQSRGWFGRVFRLAKVLR